MKNILICFVLTIAFCTYSTESEAQKRYGQTTFNLDTLSATDAITYTLPESYGSHDVSDMVSWQVRLTNLADTLTFNIYVEESIDEATSSPDYVIIDTIQASGSSIGANVLSYLSHYAIRGKKHRLRVTSTGSAATAEIEVDAWVRKKVDLHFTDEQ